MISSQVLFEAQILPSLSQLEVILFEAVISKVVEGRCASRKVRVFSGKLASRARNAFI